jgi:branched-chain amino acid transport system ATP-binding protein
LSPEADTGQGEPVRLEIRDLAVRYGVIRALQSVSLEARQGEITALVGLNGAGKSSLMRSIVGLTRPESGQILVHTDAAGAQEVATVRPWLRPERLGLGYVPEGRGLFPRMTLRENLGFGAAVGRRRTGEEAALQQTGKVNELFPWLAGRDDTVVANLSGGEQQMAAIARALLMQPTILLLDEPSIGLAPIIEEQIFEVLRRLATEVGLAILVAEQRLDVALGISDSAYLLEHGNIRAQGSPERLFEDDELAAIYLGKRVAA